MVDILHVDWQKMQGLYTMERKLRPFTGKMLKYHTQLYNVE